MAARTQDVLPIDRNRDDLPNDAVQVAEHLPCRITKDAHALRAEPCVTRAITVLAVAAGMRLAIDFDR